MVVTQNDLLWIAHSAVNFLAHRRSIHESWPGEFFTDFTVTAFNEWDFGAYIPPDPVIFLQHWPQFIVLWIEVLARGKPVICFDEIWDVLLRPFLYFFTLWASAESCWKHHSSLSLNTVSFRGGKTSLKGANKRASRAMTQMFVSLYVLWTFGWIFKFKVVRRAIIIV